MSETGSHLLKARPDAAKNAPAACGNLVVRLSVGYVYDGDGEVIIGLDAKVAAAVTDVFVAFAHTGSAYAVVSAFAGRPFP